MTKISRKIAVGILAAAMSIVSIPVHERKNTEETVRIRASMT